MSNPTFPLCVHCTSRPAHSVNSSGRGLCATCFERFFELEGMAPPKDREDIYGRLAAWGAPRESVTVCWHVAPGEDWSEHWRDYLVEWVAVTPITLLMPSTEMERCEQSGEPRQIIRWRLTRARAELILHQQYAYLATPHEASPAWASGHHVHPAPTGAD